MLWVWVCFSAEVAEECTQRAQNGGELRTLRISACFYSAATACQAKRFREGWRLKSLGHDLSVARTAILFLRILASNFRDVGGIKAGIALLLAELDNI